eukprot:NODE_75_length_2456_cov_88.420781_g54_i0.p1 GENE.NODE_75_length_2456_cov_88.420781_g54_i0~~NODE_75_length_2456_cov_88.420781_g54_i0.p1  ORF type:complete len:664 (-),score=98.03 NODE_75_length_2456_cov_88.420781_g54_i0:17-2008(-)
MSISENQARKILASKDPARYVHLNKRIFSRIFPAGYRVDSSNFDPHIMWNLGCQMACLNYQTNSLPMQMNEGKFRQNGRCGYVLKPSVMCTNAGHFDPIGSQEVTGVKGRLLNVHVISGQQIPKPKGPGKMKRIISPFVSVEIFGRQCDTHQQRTKTCKDNGFKPIWDESFVFEITMPELALLRFSVYDDTGLAGDDMIGQATIPLDSVRSGYRHVHLENDRGEPLNNCSLFVKTSITVMTSTKKYVAESVKVKTGSKFTMSSLLKGKGDVAKRRSHAIQFQKVNVSVIDAHFQSISPVIQNAVGLRDEFQFYQSHFKESLGLNNDATLRRAVALLSLEFEDSLGDVAKLVPSSNNRTENTLFRLVFSSNDVNTVISPRFDELFQGFNRFSMACEEILNSPDIIKKLENAQSVSLLTSDVTSITGDVGQLDDALESYFTQSGVKAKKMSKAKSMYSWNMQKLGGVTNSFKEAYDLAVEFRDSVKQKLHHALQSYDAELLSTLEEGTAEAPAKTNSVADLFATAAGDVPRDNTMEETIQESTSPEANTKEPESIPPSVQAQLDEKDKTIRALEDKVKRLEDELETLKNIMEIGAGLQADEDGNESGDVLPEALANRRHSMPAAVHRDQVSASDREKSPPIAEEVEQKRKQKKKKGKRNSQCVTM